MWQHLERIPHVLGCYGAGEDSVYGAHHPDTCVLIYLLEPLPPFVLLQGSVLGLLSSDEHGYTVLHSIHVVNVCSYLWILAG